MKFEQALVIAAPAEALFALTQDYSRRLEWDPFLREAGLLDGAKEAGLGTQAYCVAKAGPAMITEYISFNPPHVAAVRMTDGPWFLERFAGAWRFEPYGDRRTRVSFAYHLRARPRWLTPLLSVAFAWETSKRLRSLKRALKAAPSSTNQSAFSLPPPAAQTAPSTGSR